MKNAKKARILITIVCISLIQGLQYCVSPVLGEIQTMYPKASPTMIQLLVTVPSLPSMVMAVISGWLVVKISKKKLLLAGCFIAGVAGVLPFLSDSFEMLFFSRAFYGVGLGIALVMNTSVVAEFFEGQERVAAMGIQSAAIGASLILVNATGGFLGRMGFQYSCLLNVAGFLSMILIFVCLPDTGKVKLSGENKITLNRAVVRLSVFMLLETLFVSAYTTNIAMHVSQNLTTDSGISGTLSGIFSASQLIVGLILGLVVQRTKQYTLPMAMSFLGIGGVLIVLFPGSFVLLGIGSMFCGLSQGIFVPQASVELTSSVPPASVTIATAVFSCMMNFGQLVSPVVLNTSSRLALGEESTKNAFTVMIAAAVATSAVMAIIWSRMGRQEKK